MKKCIAIFLTLLTLCQIPFSAFAVSDETNVLEEQSEEFTNEIYEFIDDYG